MNVETIEQEAKKMHALAVAMAEQSRKVEGLCALMTHPRKPRKKRGELSEERAAELLMRRRKNIGKKHN